MAHHHSMRSPIDNQAVNDRLHHDPVPAQSRSTRPDQVPQPSVCARGTLYNFENLISPARSGGPHTHMKKLCLPLCLALSLATGVYAQETPQVLPAGTAVVVRTVDPIDSKNHEIGKTFRASLDSPVTVDGRELARKGSDVTLRIVEASSAGALKGKAELTIALVSVNSGTAVLQVNNSVVNIESSGKGKGSAAKIGGVAAAGAVLGGILGGGKGAAIGAAAGAGAGTAAAMVTGPRVKIPSETLLTFKVQ
jgi:hypothetical protein